MTASRRIFYGWWVVAVSALGLSLGFPTIIVYSFGVFIKPLVQELGATRGAVSFAFTLANLMVSICSPVVGSLTDRFGARKVVVTATALLALLLISAPLLPARIAALYLFYAAIGLVGNGSAPIPYGRVVSSWFDRRRGLALGCTLFGIGAGAIFMPSLCQRLIPLVGWRYTYAIIAVVVLAIPVPMLALVMKDSPAETGELPDGAPATRNDGQGGGAAAVKNVAALEGFTWPEARRTGIFWLMAVAVFLVAGSVHGCVLHLAPLLTDHHLPPEKVALAITVLGSSLMIGRVGSGWLLDRFFAPRVGMCIFAAAACGIALLRFAADTALVYPGVFLVGMGMGAEVDVIAFLTSRYFGLRSLGEIYGYAFSSYTLAGALGPWLMGLGFDRFGSYNTVLMAFCAASLVSAALIAPLGPYRFHPA